MILSGAGGRYPSASGFASATLSAHLEIPDGRSDHNVTSHFDTQHIETN